jgi:DNA-directed RNA polymerase I subunit RPA1
MMGKRVNYCCRSVISPDPYVGTGEIGIPKHFATTLTYPTPVTDWNITELRYAVIRGIEEYPGARWVEISSSTSSGSSSAVDGNGTTIKHIDLSRMNKKEREGVANQLLASYKRGKGGKPAIVGRQLKDGDYVLMNRQVCVLFAFFLKE